ncbi:VirB3 family type IV secretion system protein [Asticcacaulis sp. W401b]|uniref:VirB3 family type IV secretion system protein n=1 Tax=Asticcacaulis sp. W401b TaxID=3388666 RepID=UPI0039705B75
MFFGVPLIPFLVTTGAFLVVGMWLLYLLSGYATLVLMVIYVPLIVTMREITRRDDQRLRQILLRARMRVRHGAGFSHWGAISYSALRYKRRA